MPLDRDTVEYMDRGFSRLNDSIRCLDSKNQQAHAEISAKLASISEDVAILKTHPTHDVYQKSTCPNTEILKDMKETTGENRGYWVSIIIAGIALVGTIIGALI